MKLYSRVTVLLLVLQAGVTGYLIALSFANTLNNDEFALLLVVELVLFSMFTYIYRTEKLGALPNPAWIAVGLTITIGFFISTLIFTL
jgi:hypothetical protein